MADILRGHCPPAEREKREAMSDDDFWNCVLLGIEPGERPDYEPDYEPEDFEQILDPCPDCGSCGPCGYDEMGRPMIHVTGEEDE